MNGESLVKQLQILLMNVETERRIRNDDDIKKVTQKNHVNSFLEPRRDDCLSVTKIDFLVFLCMSRVQYDFNFARLFFSSIGTRATSSFEN